MTSTQRLKLLTNMVKEEGYEGTARKMAKYIEEFNPSGLMDITEDLDTLGLSEIAKQISTNVKVWSLTSQTDF